MGLMMKYFVLKPRGGTKHAQASRQGILAYADEIQRVEPELAEDLRIWVQREIDRQDPPSESSRSCTRCKYASVDPDGGFCSHPSSQNDSNIFGLSWTAARREGSLCGPEGKLWEQMSEDRMKALGLLTGED